MTTDDWIPTPPDCKGRARRALREEYERWTTHGHVWLTSDAGWPLGLPASTAEAWSTIVNLLSTASDRIGRYSHATRTSTATQAVLDRDETA